MSRWTQIQAKLANALHPQHDSLLFTLAHADEALCRLTFTPTPERRFFAWRRAEDDAVVWFAYSLLMQPEGMASDGEWFLLQAGRSGALVEDGLSAKSFHRAPSLPHFPCSPSVTRSVLIPRPSALGVLLRLRRPKGFGFQKIFCAKNAKRFPEPSEKDTPTALGSGAHSRRFAQECPEGNPGKSKQEKRSWHFMKTTSR